jgi:hypothetical protein
MTDELKRGTRVQIVCRTLNEDAAKYNQAFAIVCSRLRAKDITDEKYGVKIDCVAGMYVIARHNLEVVSIAQHPIQLNSSRAKKPNS